MLGFKEQNKGQYQNKPKVGPIEEKLAVEMKRREKKEGAEEATNTRDGGWGEDKIGKKKVTPAGKHVTSQYCNFFIWASKNSSTFIFTPLPSYPSGEGKKKKKAAEHGPETKTQDMDIKKNKIPTNAPSRPGPKQVFIFSFLVVFFVSFFLFLSFSQIPLMEMCLVRG